MGGKVSQLDQKSLRLSPAEEEGWGVISRIRSRNAEGTSIFSKADQHIFLVILKKCCFQYFLDLEKGASLFPLQTDSVFTISAVLKFTTKAGTRPSDVPRSPWRRALLPEMDTISCKLF